MPMTRAPEQADADRDHRDLDRDPRGVDRAREHVPAELVGAEPVRGARPLQHRGHVEVVGRIGRDPGGEQGRRHDAEDQKAADQ